MNNMVMLVKDRPILTQQALRSLTSHSKYEWSVTIVDDGSRFHTERLLEGWRSEDIQIVKHYSSTNNIAFNKNLGVYWSEHYFGRGDFLYLSDNDAYFTPNWDLFLLNAYAQVKESYKLLGPYRHPYHHPNEVVQVGDRKVVSVDTVQGLGFLMGWDVWDEFGPLKIGDNGKRVELKGQGNGTNDGEDVEFCQAIVDAGYKVGNIEPFVVYNCGITGSDGKRSPGAELVIKEKQEGVTYL